MVIRIVVFIEVVSVCKTILVSVCGDKFTFIVHGVVLVVVADINAFDVLVFGDGLGTSVGVGIVWQELELVDNIVYLGDTGLHVINDRDGNIEPVVGGRGVDVGQRGARPLVRREVDVVVRIEVAVHVEVHVKVRGEVHLFKRPVKKRVIFVVLVLVLQGEIRLVEGRRRIEVGVRHVGQVGIA